VRLGATLVVALAAASFGAGAQVGTLSGEGGVEMAPLLDGAIGGRDTGRASGTAPPSPPAESVPTRGGLTIGEWRRSANWHASQVRKLRAANRERITMGGLGVARGFLCIHRYEGSWTDPAAPHYGGLQMDLDFQRSYGGAFLDELGTADRWPPFVQLAVAMEAYYSGRGYGPWPNTRKSCGL
jgi:hypothetical protein